MICRRTGDGESKARVEPAGGCIHPKGAQPEGLPFHLGTLDQPPNQNGTDTSPLKLWQEEDLCKEEVRTGRAPGALKRPDQTFAPD